MKKKTAKIVSKANTKKDDGSVYVFGNGKQSRITDAAQGLGCTDAERKKIHNWVDLLLDTNSPKTINTISSALEGEVVFLRLETRIKEMEKELLNLWLFCSDKIYQLYGHKLHGKEEKRKPAWEQERPAIHLDKGLNDF